jgi:protein-histidine N-methyltransferase
MRPSRTDDPHAPSGLLAWLERRGASFTPLAISPHGSACRTVLTAAPIVPDDVVLRIPLRLLLTAEVARASVLGRAITASGMEPRGNHVVLAACLLEEREKARSRFRPYLDSLPASFPTLPLFFAPDEVALLQGSCALEKLAVRRGSLRRDYRALCHAVPAFRRFPYDDFVWARSCVITRVFGLTVAGKRTEALVPLADMLNHAHPAETHWAYEEDAGAFVMTAVVPIRAGDPVHDSYGRKSNARLLVNYGFTLDDNDDDDEAAVRLAIPEGAPLAGEKARLLGAPQGELATFRVPAPSGEGTAAAALSFLRVASATPREMEILRGAPIDAAHVLPLNGRNESAALGLLAAACERALQAFPTAVEQDDALLQEGALSLNARNAVVARRSEKRVLLRCLEVARAAAPLLRLPLPSLARALDEGAARGAAKRYLAGFVAAVPRRRPSAPTPALDGGRRIR